MMIHYDVQILIEASLQDAADEAAAEKYKNSSSGLFGAVPEVTAQMGMGPFKFSVNTEKATCKPTATVRFIVYGPLQRPPAPAPSKRKLTEEIVKGWGRGIGPRTSG